MKRITLSAVALPLALSAGAAIAAEEGVPTLRALGDLPAGLTAMRRGELVSIEGGQPITITLNLTLPITTQVANQVATAVAINVAALTTDVIQATDQAISQAMDQVAP